MTRTLSNKPVYQLANIALALAYAGGMSACGGGHSHRGDINFKPAYLGAISTTAYDGVTDDLLTGGLGKTGLAGAAPGYADAANPTAAELRRNAIYNNYRAVLDINPNSGYGTLYGPNIDANGAVTAQEGLIAGREYLVYTDSGSGTENVTLMVQVPTGFDPSHPCIITGTSSGSRGIYGAIGSSGEWGLKHHCAVAYADKGSGIGLYTFDDDGVNLQNGLRSARTVAGANANFVPLLSDLERSNFLAVFPNRLAFKHAHSQQNPEKDWGKWTLRAVEFAYYVLNEQFGSLAGDGVRHEIRLTPRNTVVIASSISNGAGAALLAAEQDTRGLISGVAVSEPQVQPSTSSGYAITQGGVLASAQGKHLLDYSSHAALYQPCVAGSAGRCTALVGKGLLSGEDLAAQQSDALQRMRAYGWLADSDALQAAHAGTNILVAVTYLNAYGRFSVLDKVCGFSFAATSAAGVPVPLSSAQKLSSFASQNGIVGGVVYEDAVGGAAHYTLAVSPSSGLADQSLDGFLCLRSLAIGRDAVTGGQLDSGRAALSTRVRTGMEEVVASANLHGKPAIIVAGRSDTLIGVNQASRAYVGLNQVKEGSSGKLRYIEVTHANHFDSFVSALPTAVVPLHVYLNRALDAMYSHLTADAVLPPSQVVHTVTRADVSTPITVANVPPIDPAPAADSIIDVIGTTVTIPD